jgi:glycine/sarcosine N-methyltransferase
VSASDGSEAMVAEARRLAAQSGVGIPVRTCAWEDLPGRFDQLFDVVLCLGNSISHLPGDAMVPAFRGMGAVLGDRGLVVLNARNWEKLRRERPRLSHPDRVVVRDGRRCVPLYVWSYADDWGDAHNVEIVFILDTAGSLTTRRHELTFWPFRVTDLHDRLEAAGFRVVDDTYRPENDWYEVIAERLSPSRA